MWNVKGKVIPIIIGANGILSRSFKKYLDDISSKHCSVEQQKTAILGIGCFKTWNFIILIYTSQYPLCNEPQGQDLALGQGQIPCEIAWT
jgi:hypothetical protein